MFETANEKQEDSPLQALLEGIWCLIKFDRILASLEDKPSTHGDVQEAANADN